MTTLYNRATPRQHKVLRIIEGAAMSAAHAHPSWNFARHMARSIAKRAAGTLTAAWPDVLAAPAALSDQPGSEFGKAPANRGFILGNPRGGASQKGPRRTPLRRLHGKIGKMAGAALRSGDDGRHAALVDVLRLIGKEMER